MLTSDNTLAAQSAFADELTQLQQELLQRFPKSNTPLNGLSEWLLDQRNLQAAWSRVASTPGANTPGPDGQTCSEIEPRRDRWLKQLREDLQQRAFQPQAARLIDIPKSSGGVRTIGVLAVRDRVVHAALKQVLEPLWERFFAATSYGFRPGRSVATALSAALSQLARAEQPRTQRNVPSSTPPATEPNPIALQRPRFEVAVHLDIEKCFDRIDHQLLLAALRQQIADPLLITLLSKILAVSGQSVGWLRPRCRGLVQGSGLSPLLTNFFLHPLDERLAEACASQSGLALRYADDLWIAAPDAAALRRIIRTAQDELSRLRLNFGSPLMKPTSLDVGGDWLGVILKRQALPWNGQSVYGFEIPLPKIRHLFEVIDEMTEPPSDRLHGDVFRLGSWIASLNEQLRQWHEVYCRADNAQLVFRSLDEHLKSRLHSLLREVTGARGQQIYDRFRKHLPRGFWTWEVEGARLVCLPALAPRSPKITPRRPPWERPRRQK